MFQSWALRSTDVESMGVSRGVRPRSSEIGSSKYLVLKEFFWGGNTAGLVPSSLPHTLGDAWAVCTPTFPLQIVTLPPITKVTKHCLLTKILKLFCRMYGLHEEFPEKALSESQGSLRRKIPSELCTETLREFFL